MGKRYLVTRPDGGLSVIKLSERKVAGVSARLVRENRLAKTLFEISREIGSDMTTHFDPAVHTLDVIARGIPGHVPCVSRECDEADLPRDRTSRNAWEDTGTAVRVRPTP